METARRMVVARGCLSGGNVEMLVKDDKLLTVRRVSSGDLTYSVLTIVILCCVLMFVK